MPSTTRSRSGSQALAPTPAAAARGQAKRGDDDTPLARGKTAAIPQNIEPPRRSARHSNKQIDQDGGITHSTSVVNPADSAQALPQGTAPALPQAPPPPPPPSDKDTSHDSDSDSGSDSDTDSSVNAKRRTPSPPSALSSSSNSSSVALGELLLFLAQLDM